MLGRPMVKKIAEMVGMKFHTKADVDALRAAAAKRQGPITRTMTLPNGKSITVLRKDTFERAVDRAREVA